MSSEPAGRILIVNDDAGSQRRFARIFAPKPAGWDTFQTVRRLWQLDPDLHAVICLSYSEPSWSDIVAALGKTSRLLILGRPFSAAEVLQSAVTLVRKAQFERGRGIYARSDERDLGIPKLRMRGRLS